MPYDTENVLTSQKPYEVFREIARSDEGSYGSEIARNLDMKQQLASEIVNNLEKTGIISKGKRTRAQYYEIDTQGLSNLFWELLESDIRDSSNRDLSSCLNEIIEKSNFSEREHFERTVRKFLGNYTEFYLRGWEESTIKTMLIDDLFSGLNGISSLEDSPAWIFILKDLGDLRNPYLEDSESAVRWALQRSPSSRNEKEIQKQKKDLIDKAKEMDKEELEENSGSD